MNRREAIIKLAVLMGATVVGPRLFAAALDPAVPGTSPVAAPAALSEAATLALLDEIGDTIIPATAIPGAKAVNIGAFIAMMVRDCYDTPVQAAFVEGLGRLTAGFEQRHGHAFAKGTSEERTAFLNELDREQRAYALTKTKDQPWHYFLILKEMTVLGFFSSEIGATQALRYLETPGRYDGSAPYAKGDRAWYAT